MEDLKEQPETVDGSRASPLLCRLRLVCFLDANGDEWWRIQKKQWFWWVTLVDYKWFPLGWPNLPPAEFTSYEEALEAAKRFAIREGRKVSRKVRTVNLSA